MTTIPALRLERQRLTRQHRRTAEIDRALRDALHAKLRRELRWGWLHRVACVFVWRRA